MIDFELLEWSVVKGLALAQLGMSALGISIIWVLDIKKGIDELKPILKRLFMVYGGYVLGTNLFYGIVLMIYPQAILEGGIGSFFLTLYLFLYWGVRFALQIGGLDDDAIPDGPLLRTAKFMLIVTLTIMTSGYGFLLWRVWLW